MRSQVTSVREIGVRSRDRWVGEGGKASVGDREGY